METIVKTYIIKELRNIQEKNIKVTKNNYVMVMERMKFDYNQAVLILRDLKESGIIQSVYIPKNKKIQGELDNLVNCKRILRCSMSKLRTIFK